MVCWIYATVWHEQYNKEQLRLNYKKKPRSLPFKYNQQ